MMRLLIGAVFLFCSVGIGKSRSTRDVNSVNSASQTHDKRILCYYTNWAMYRQANKYNVEDINPHLCTHLLYAYGALNEEAEISSFDPYQDIQLEGYKKFVALKKINPDLKVIFSIGGSKQGSHKFSTISGDPILRSKLAKNTLAYLKKYGFDGIDVVWKYPNSPENPHPADKENFVKLIRELREELKDVYSISIVVPAFEDLIDNGINIPELSKYVDFMTVLTYDYHKATDPTLGHVAPLYSLPEDAFKDLNVDSSIQAYLSRGADPAKLNLAISLYGVSFILEDPTKTNIGDSSEDEGEGTQERGAKIYNEFCGKIKDSSWTVKHVNKTAVGPYAYKGTQWIAFDDEDMIRTKARYAMNNNLGGLLFWTIDMDDFVGNICQSDKNIKYPLIKAAREEFLS